VTALFYGILLLTAVIMVAAAVRSRFFLLRRIGAYAAMPMAVGEAVESDRSLHVSLGSSAVHNTTTLAAVASVEVLYHLAERASLSDRRPLLTLSDPVTLALAQDTLRRAYKSRDMLRKYRASSVQWFPAGPASFAFAAGAGAAMRDEQISSNVLVGVFGSEMMLLVENAVRYDRGVIAQSDDVRGQAVAYAVSETPLIGEELYAGGAYLGRTPITVGGVVAQDVLRYLVVLIIIVLAVLSIAGATNF